MTKYDEIAGFDDMFFSREMWKYLSKIRNDKEITLQDLSKKMWEKSHTRATSALNGSRKESDAFFSRIAEALWLSEKEYERLVIQAKQAEMVYTHGQIIHSDETDPDILIATSARHLSISEDDLRKAVELYKVYKK